MEFIDIVQREGELISLPVEKLHALKTACDYINTYNLLDEVKSMFSTGLLSPLTLKDDEFNKTPNDDGNFENLRYPDIIKTGLGKILNLAAHGILIRAKYNHDNKCQEEYKQKTLKSKPRIYISKGGVITGEYLDNFIIKDEFINKGCFEIGKTIFVPVSIIIRKEETYYVVDHREPSLKLLSKYYDIATLVDEKVQKFHMNLREYKKLNK